MIINLEGVKTMNINKISRAKLQMILKEELETLQYEGKLGSAIKAIGAQALPGVGRFMMDYSRSEAFDEIAEKLEELEARIVALEQNTSLTAVNESRYRRRRSVYRK